MDERIKRQVREVLEKYEKEYSNDGVDKNLSKWEENKGRLVNLLRKHPSWNEDELAVTFEITESRDIIFDEVWDLRDKVFDLSRDIEMTRDDRLNLDRALGAACSGCKKLVSGSGTVEIIKNTSGVDCVEGQKTSRVINAICKKFGIDKHPEYNARFAKLADSLNPLQIKRTALLSVHPCDYLEMSNRDNSWRSCHRLDNGEYHAGTLSYMNDGVTMIFYTVDDGVFEGYYKHPKRTRQVFCYADGVLLQSRLYPKNDDDESRDTYRQIVQQAIASCLEIPNLWTLKKEREYIDEWCSTHDDSLHYPDYQYSEYRANISLLKGMDRDNTGCVIGHTAYCLNCADKLTEANNMFCDDCDNCGRVVCQECGYACDREDAFYIGGNWYCDECSFYCGHCDERCAGESYSAIGRSGRMIDVCESCRDDYYSCCVDCGTLFLNNSGVDLDDGYHCVDCLERLYHCCDDCGEYVHCDNVVEIDGEYFCEDCAEDMQAKIRSEEVPEYAESVWGV